MNELPWILVHGALVWKLAALALAALGCIELRVSLHQRARAMRRWAGVFFSRSAAVDPHGNAVAEGVLERIDGDVAAFDGGAPAAVTAVRSERVPDSLVDAADRSACARAAKVGLRCDDGRLVELDGAILLASAQTERWSHTKTLKHDRALRERVTQADSGGAAMLENERVCFASARWGERVQVYGRLESVQIMREAPRQVMSAPVSLESGAAAPMPAMVMASVEPLAFVGPTRQAYGRTALLTLAMALAGQALLGEFALLQVRGASAGSGALRDNRAEGLRVQLASWATLAAITPLRRAEAMTFMASTATRAPRDRREVQLLSGLWAMSARCENAVSLLARHGRAQEAIDVGAACDTPASRWEAAEIAHDAGDFERASGLLDRTREPPAAYQTQWIFVMLTHLLAHHPDRAIFAAHQAIARSIHDQRSGLAHEIECVAWALEARAGSAASGRSLAARAASGDSDRCALLHADLLQGDARLRFMEGAGVIPQQASVSDPRWLLALEADGASELAAPAVRHPEDLAREVACGQWGRYDATLASLAAAAQQRLVASHRSVAGRELLTDSRMIFHAMTADREGARARLRDFDEGAAHSDRDRALLDAGIDLRTGFAHDAATRMSVYGSAEPSGVQSLAAAIDAEDIHRVTDDSTGLGGEAGSEAIVALLRQGNGAALAERLWGSPRTLLNPTLALGMFAVRGAPMTEWLRWGTRAVCWRCVSESAISSHSNAWLMARALGARDVEAAERQALQRWGRALEARDLAVPLWVTESL